MAGYEDTGERKFNTISGVVHSPKDLLLLDILQQKFNIMEAYEQYEIRIGKNLSPENLIIILRARVKRTIRELKKSYERHYKSEGYQELLKQAGGNVESLLIAMVTVLDFLDYIRLTRIDVDYYDVTDIDLEDSLSGL